MRVFLVFSVACFTPFFLSATTLGEIGAAGAIAGKLNEIAQPKATHLLDKVKQQVQKYEEVEQKKIAGIKNSSTPVQSAIQHLTQHSHTQKDIRNLSANELADRLQDSDIESEASPVDYKASMQIFYKRSCSPSEVNCNKGAVLTNIKSVIFDYAHSRGSFAKNQPKQ